MDYVLEDESTAAMITNTMLIYFVVEANCVELNKIWKQVLKNLSSESFSYGEGGGGVGVGVT